MAIWHGCRRWGTKRSWSERRGECAIALTCKWGFVTKLKLPDPRAPPFCWRFFKPAWRMDGWVHVCAFLYCIMFWRSLFDQQAVTCRGEQVHLSMTSKVLRRNQKWPVIETLATQSLSPLDFDFPTPSPFIFREMGDVTSELAMHLIFQKGQDLAGT